MKYHLIGFVFGRRFVTLHFKSPKVRVLNVSVRVNCHRHLNTRLGVCRLGES